MPELTKAQEKEVKEEIKKEVQKKLRDRLKSSASNFKKELKKHTSTAIAAAFAFLIALSWRTPIQNSVDSIIVKLSLDGGGIYIEYLSAIIITMVAVLALMLISKWTAEKK